MNDSNELNLGVVEIKAFIPALDFETSKAFYQDMGFILDWEEGGLAYFHFQTSSFLLNRVDHKEAVGQLMMHLLVEDADAWYGRLIDANLADKYSIPISVPEDRPWLIRDFTVIDPAGVLWRIGHNIKG